MKVFSIIIAISGVIIACINYKSQQKQRKFDNSKKLIEKFQNTISENHLNQWKQVFLNSYESVGAKPGCFIVFNSNNQPRQIPQASLFISEGKGLHLSDIKMNLNDDISNINFESIRHITEQLEIISYEILHGHTELTVLYYELGQIISSIYYWIDSIEDEYSRNNTRSLYPSFVQMYQKNKRRLEKMTCKTYQGLC